MRLLFSVIAMVGLSLTLSDAQGFRLGAPVSDFIVSDMNGRPVHYDALKGKVTVVIFFPLAAPFRIPSTIAGTSCITISRAV